jgi:hypothetical protein
MKFIARFALLLSLSIVCFSQTEDRGFTFHAGGGYTPLIGDLSDRLDHGWNFQAGGGYMFTPHLGLIADYQYNSLGVPRSILNELQVPDGSAWVHSFTAGPEIRFAPESRFSPYAVAEVGWYRRTIEFTAPTTATVTLFDPFYGFFFPAVIPTNQILGTITRDGFGGNVGGGLTFRLGDGRAKLFAEARYHHAAHERADTQLIPVTVGLRW